MRQINLRLPDETLDGLNELLDGHVSRERFLRAVVTRVVDYYRALGGGFDGERYVTETEAGRLPLTSGWVLRTLRDAVVISDVDEIVCDWNAGAERMFGFTRAEAVGRNVLELLPSKFTSHEDREHIQSISEHGCWRGRGTWYAKDGTAVEADALGQVLVDFDGELRGFVGVFRPTG